eukprot:CAMPEP_0114592004 /NCGR_PEP_ID=MMETSP0125-20121206/13943_1 /TAXON_ID=485358 ORGANISM="Aristerostoma sp., Strain ATCC 50986" /NCGR_SAMPLE_ID=MMETSP0125 /ASSEMBLY_ACC=CAM_ASM_000245 /LENGTH=146 /DNA_ID=CAMNT_0001790439 /DNA_START=42 /DNA_END=482 /DNA_ORIENTATION=-
MVGIVLIVCRNHEGKWLAIKETKNRGWWLPGGRVDPPEDWQTAALRECKEEAGIDIELKGVLRFENNISGDGFLRAKVVFYAEPKDPKQKPKDWKDSESEEARWVSRSDMTEIEEKDPIGWRGYELLEWSQYLEKGGVIYPLSFVA